MIIELADPTGTLLQEIENSKCTRNVVAKTYALALLSTVETDWARVNRAIIARWSHSALEWIKARAWSGKCFETANATGERPAVAGTLDGVVGNSGDDE